MACIQCCRRSFRLLGASKVLRRPTRVRPLATQHIYHRSLTTSPLVCPQPEVNVYGSPGVEVDLPEVDLTRYLLDDLGRHGDKLAMVHAVTGQEVTFSELQTQIVRTASGLARMGIRQGDTVTLFLPNCLEFPVVFLAVTALGAVASAVNCVYTSGELAHALNLARSKLLVTSSSLLPVAQEAIAHCPGVKEVLTTDSAPGHRKVSSLYEDDGSLFPDHLDLRIREDIAALPFSSGTTGLPKGVMLSHYNIVVNLQQMSSPMVVGYHDEDRVLGVLPFFHIYGMAIVLLYSLKMGQTISVMSAFDPKVYLDTIQAHKLTHLYIVPPIVLFMAKHPMISDYDLSSVTDIISAAAPVSPEVCAEVQARLNLPDLSIRQGYGMTETSPITHCNPREHNKLASVGICVPNTLAKIVDVESGKALAPHMEGEICMKGPQVMLGYFENEQATKDTVDKDGWIHTGDLGYVDEDGYFFITDRIKELIKYKGLQVAPAELESLLVLHPAVADAAVISVPDDRAGELPRAYVVLKPEAKASEDDIADYIKSQVSDHKQLRGGVSIREEIPKSASGKILRRLLKEEYMAAQK